MSLSNKLASQIFESLSLKEVERIILVLKYGLESENAQLDLSKQELDFVLSIVKYYETLS